LVLSARRLPADGGLDQLLRGLYEFMRSCPQGEGERGHRRKRRRLEPTLKLRDVRAVESGSMGKLFLREVCREPPVSQCLTKRGAKVGRRPHTRTVAGGRPAVYSL
jgi:hypothetical protein